MTTTSISDFKIEKILGKGSFGNVYLVTRKKDKKIYALKTVILEKLNKKEQDNSVNEVRILASINHPNVIGYKEAFWDDKTNSLNIVMEYADDGDLQSKIIKMRNENGFFKESIIWEYSIQMIEGLKALHDKKIMHRDLKSANIFLIKNKHQCKLGDMNVSKVIKEKVLTTQTGTPYYASPEVWRDEPYSYKSDLWSIGCVIYEMCELRPPFNGKDLDDLFENVCRGKIKRINSFYSDELWNMILMLLQIDVDKRVDCDGFLNSEIIKNKINEFINNPYSHYEGSQLAKNKNYNNEDDILYGTINFKNLEDLKNKLPNMKNYEKKNKINKKKNNNNKENNNDSNNNNKNDNNNNKNNNNDNNKTINNNENNNNKKNNTDKNNKNIKNNDSNNNKSNIKDNNNNHNHTNDNVININGISNKIVNNNIINKKNIINSNDNNNNKNNMNITKSKNDSINALITNSSIKSNINTNLSINNILSNNSSSTNEKKTTKKKIVIENINVKSNKINKIFYVKENQNINNIKVTNSKPKIFNKNIMKKMPKNTSFNGISHSSYINIIKKEKNQKVGGIIDINSSDRNLIKKKSKNNKEFIRFEKKKFKEFEKIIEYNKIKELLKMGKKKDKNTNNTERSKKDIKKSCGNLFRNKTENNNKIMNTKINNDREESKRMQKNSSTNGNSNKSNVIKGIKSEQKLSFVNRIYKMEFGKYEPKKIIKSPTSISIMQLNKNNKRSHSQGINGRSIELINNKKTSLKNKLNNIYSNLFKNLNDNKNKDNKMYKLLSRTPYTINRKKKDKSTKRNLTTIPYNNETNNYIKTIKNTKYQNRLLNEVFNTVNFNIIKK